MKLLAFMISSASGLKGGSLASAIRTFRNHGDPFVKNFVNQMLTKVSKPIFNMIQVCISLSLFLISSVLGV